MATDHYGQVIGVGDRVTKVGYCDEFTIFNIKYGGDCVDLIGYHGEERDVRSNDVIKK